jgi:hypothetical protein
MVWIIGLIVGVLVGWLPLVFTTKGDPFDHGSSYLIWVAGYFFTAMFAAVRKTNLVWRLAIVVGVGFPIAVILDSMIKPEAYNLLPLTILFSVFVAIPSALAGAYCGRFFKRGGIK